MPAEAMVYQPRPGCYGAFRKQLVKLSSSYCVKGHGLFSSFLAAMIAAKLSFW
jgi:hypothetical protein